MKPVILESPYAGDTFRNQHYARLCMIDSRERGEAPFVSHLLYTQILDDDDPIQRQMGISAGHSFISRVDKMVVYTDRGISEGMRAGIAEAERHQIPIEYRELTSESTEKLRFPQDVHMPAPLPGKCSGRVPFLQRLQMALRVMLG